MALFIIGAGATRGCSFVDAKKNPCLPPLDGDYFSQLQKISNKKHHELISEVMEDVVKVFGVNFNVTMETVFTTYEHMSKMVSATGKEGNFKKNDLKEMRERLQQSIHAVLEESLVLHDTKAGSSLQMNTCNYHDKLVSEIMQKEDAIVSFNYDCVLDDSLKRNGNTKWDPRYGYGFVLGSKGNRLKGDDYWKPETPSDKDKTIKYFKLHGSLNFDVKNIDSPDSQVTLKQRPYTRQHGRPKFTIIPPEWNKSFDTGFFGQLWGKAANEINKHKHIAVLGYSMPTTDLHSSSLFRTSLKSGALKSLVVINPDQEARKRIRDTFSISLTKNTKVISCSTLEEFVHIDKSIWRV